VRVRNERDNIKAELIRASKHQTSSDDDDTSMDDRITNGQFYSSKRRRPVLVAENNNGGNSDPKKTPGKNPPKGPFWRRVPLNPAISAYCEHEPHSGLCRAYCLNINPDDEVCQKWYPQT